jgi:maleylacetoacetate isomerase
MGEWPPVKGVVERGWELEAFRRAGLGGHGRLRP